MCFRDCTAVHLALCCSKNLCTAQFRSPWQRSYGKSQSLSRWNTMISVGFFLGYQLLYNAFCTICIHWNSAAGSEWHENLRQNMRAWRRGWPWWKNHGNLPFGPLCVCLSNTSLLVSCASDTRNLSFHTWMTSSSLHPLSQLFHFQALPRKRKIQIAYAGKNGEIVHMLITFE